MKYHFSKIEKGISDGNYKHDRSVCCEHNMNNLVKYKDDGYYDGCYTNNRRWREICMIFQ